MEKLKKAADEWQNGVLKKALERSPERKKIFTTESGIPVKRLYTPLDLEGTDYLEDNGFPGSYPYTRGVYPSMYRGRPWTMRMYAGFGTAKYTNERFKYLLSQGMPGLSIAFDLPTQLGYDSDHPLAEGAVGKVGVAVDSLADMEIIFDEIPLEKISTSMTINSPATILLAMYIALAEKKGIPAHKLTGTTQNDMLKEFIARGTYIFPVEPSLKLVMDIVEYCFKNVPRWNTLSIAGYHIREAGANAVQELAFTLANAIAYIEAAQERGLQVDDFAPRLSYSLGCHRDFFEEIAKFRAGRRLFARIMKDRFQAKDPKSYLFRTFSGSCGSTLVLQQPRNNSTRITMHALMAILGGHQSIHTASWDEGLALPTEESSKMALRTQQILAHESGLCNTIDPLAGSYFVESLTTEIEKRAKEYLDKIEEMGGMLKAIENGYIFKEIQESSLKLQKEIDTGERVIVGVNKFVEAEEEQYSEQDLFSVDPEIEESQKEKLAKVRASRNSSEVRVALSDLNKAIDNQENLMPCLIKAVKCYTTIGEICDVMRNKWGEFKTSTSF